MTCPVLRINCGSPIAFTDPEGAVWQADRAADAPGWGRVGGLAVQRPMILPVHPAAWGGLLRSEAFDLKTYRFDVPAGVYQVGLIVAETFPSLESLQRTFSVSINGRIVVSAVTPAVVGGGFARAGKVTIRGVAVGAGGLEVGFSSRAALAGIEVLPDLPEVPCSVTTSAWAPELERTQPQGHKSRKIRMHVIGNSGSFFWAVPESSARLVALHSDFRLDISTFYAAGRGVRFHLEAPAVAATLAAGGLDLVVIQDHSSGPLDKPDDFATCIPELIRRVRAAGALPVLYAYSGPQKYSVKERRKIQEKYDDMGAAHRVPVIPCAAALALAMEREPQLDFHDHDTHHLGIAGGSLAVYTWYRALCGAGASVLRDRAVLDGYAELPPELSRTLARIADEACVGRGSGILKKVA